MTAEKPMGIAMLLCDQVIAEVGTNKKSLIGIFNQIYAKTFPCRHPRMSIFVSIVGLKGSAKVDLKFENPSHEFMLGAENQIKSDNPTTIVEMNFEFNGITFAEPGIYSIHFLLDGEPMLNRDLHMIALQEGKK